MKTFGKDGEIMNLTLTVAGGRRTVGSVALTAGQEGGTVSFVPVLDYTPKKVGLSVRKPAGGLGLGANVTGTPTASGFDYELTNGSPDAVGTYYLDYEVSE